MTSEGEDDGGRVAAPLNRDLAALGSEYSGLEIRKRENFSFADIDFRAGRGRELAVFQGNHEETYGRAAGEAEQDSIQTVKFADEKSTQN